MPPEIPSLPMQPVERDANQIIRFVENKVVRVLYDWAKARGMGMNELYVVVGHKNPEHMMQFAQLTGYSVSGYHELSYVTDESASKAADLVHALTRRTDEAPSAPPPPTFERELVSLLNRYSKDNAANTADFVLAEYLINCLQAFTAAVNMRDAHDGRTR